MIESPRLLRQATVYIGRFVYPSRRPSLRIPKRLIIVGALLALLAMINVTGLSIWHAAIADHDDSKVVRVLGSGNQGESPVPDLDLHKAAHSAIHELADLARSNDSAAAPYEISGSWVIPHDYVERGLSPEGLFRPPRG